MSNHQIAATNVKPSAKSFNDLMSRSTQSLRSPVSGTRLGPEQRFPTPANVSHQPLFLQQSFVSPGICKSLQGRSVYCHQFLPHNTNLLPFGTSKTLQVDLEHNIQHLSKYQENIGVSLSHSDMV